MTGGGEGVAMAEKMLEIVPGCGSRPMWRVKVPRGVEEWVWRTVVCGDRDRDHGFISLRTAYLMAMSPRGRRVQPLVITCGTDALRDLYHLAKDVWDDVVTPVGVSLRDREDAAHLVLTIHAQTGVIPEDDLMI